MPDEPKHILLFDDDYEGMSALKNVLHEFFGYQVELTAGQTLPERLGHERFDLICVDLMIHPISFDADGNEIHNVHFAGVNWQKTGLEFLRRLRRGEFFRQSGSGTSPQVPVIVLSAVASYSVEDELVTDGVEYVEKPFALEEILERIGRLLKESS
jgi:CheY-like chemotaxis protein